MHAHCYLRHSVYWVCRSRAPAGEADPPPEPGDKPFLCPACRAKRRAAWLNGPQSLVVNPDEVAQQYLQRWTQTRKSGGSITDYAELAAPSGTASEAGLQTAGA